MDRPLTNPLKTGDVVEATYMGVTVRAKVTLASKNGRSLIISWKDTGDGMLGGHAGAMPICGNDDGYRSLIEGKPITLVKLR